MAQHVPPGLGHLLRLAGLLDGVAAVEHDCVHPEQRPFVLGVREEPLALHRRRYDVGHLGTLLRQVRREIHFFPTIALLDGDAGKPELRADRVALHEVDGPVWVTRLVYSRGSSIWTRGGFSLRTFGSGTPSSICQYSEAYGSTLRLRKKLPYPSAICSASRTRRPRCSAASLAEAIVILSSTQNARPIPRVRHPRAFTASFGTLTII